MGYFKDIEEVKFVSSIRANYDFLINKYGFGYSSDDSREHHYKSERCRVSIYYYRHELNIYIAPLDEAFIQVGITERIPSKDVGLVAFQFGANGPTRLSSAHAENCY